MLSQLGLSQPCIPIPTTSPYLCVNSYNHYVCAKYNMEPNTGLAPVSLRYELSVSLSILVGHNIAGSPSIVKRKVFQDFPVASRFPHLIEVPERCRFGTCHIISIHSIFGTTGRNRTHVNPVKSREHRHSATVVYFWSGRWDLNPQSLRSEQVTHPI